MHSETLPLRVRVNGKGKDFIYGKVFLFSVAVPYPDKGKNPL